MDGSKPYDRRARLAVLLPTTPEIETEVALRPVAAMANSTLLVEDGADTVFEKLDPGGRAARGVLGGCRKNGGPCQKRS